MTFTEYLWWHFWDATVVAGIFGVVFMFSAFVVLRDSLRDQRERK